MPIVEIKMFEGRSSTAKEFIARGVVDTVSETATVGREGVHVIFDEQSRDDWAIGPRLTSHRESEPSTDLPAALVTIARIHIQSDKHEEYLDWRKNSVYPYMAQHEGFIASSLLDVPGEPDQYVIINKWESSEAYDAYLEHPREAELRVEAKSFVSQLAADILSGSVIDVFNR